MNWWGADPPDTSKFLGPVDYVPWLDSPPEGGGGAQSVEDRLVIPATYALSMPFPNPFASATVIRYQLPQVSQMTLKVYDITGRLVQTLVDARKKPGYYQIIWKGEDRSGRRVSSGVYLCKMEANRISQRDGPPQRRRTRGEAGSYRSTNKLLLVR